MYSSCGGTITDLQGQIRYPYSGNYHNNLRCTWRINSVVPIDIQFTRFDLEYQATCGWDYLQISENGTSHGKYCGTTFPQNLTLQGNITFDFRSDGSAVRSGFIINMGEYEIL